MKKIIFYLPAIIFTVLYGILAVGDVGEISPIVIIWLALLFASGFILNKKYFWGGLLGILPGIHMIYMGTVESAQIFNEMPIGGILIIFYIICAYYVFTKNKQQRVK